MNLDCPTQFSHRLDHLRASPIREILKVVDRPDMISFAGGLPAPESFPSFDSVVPRRYFQYGPSEGEPALRQKIAELLCARGLKCYMEQILILSGSQQGIDLTSKLFIDPGTHVAIEAPTYLAAIQVFEFFGARFSTLSEISNHTKLVYINPTFQNPTGYCYSADERSELARICDENNVPLFEDDPYYDLAYDDVCRTPVSPMLKKSAWIYQGSFSKSLAPGLRLGFLACSPCLMPYFTQLKQAVDLHSNRISQFYVLQQLMSSDYEDRIDRIRQLYLSKRNRFANALKINFADLAEWSVPSGGLFFG